jgi:hypothetical protein
MLVALEQLDWRPGLSAEQPASDVLLVYAGKLIDDSESSPRFQDIATANWRAQPVFGALLQPALRRCASADNIFSGLA